MNRKSSKYQEAQRQRLNREERIGEKDFRGGLNTRPRETPEQEREGEQEEDNIFSRRFSVDKKTGEKIWIF